MESARQTTTRALESALGQNGFHLKIKVYPYQILRENPLAAGAGADRFSTGMKKSFGKPIGNAARVKKGQTVFQVSVDKTDLEVGRLALSRASKKLPSSYSVELVENKS